MANWEKLNKEFNDVIDNMSAEDWQLWKIKCDKRRADRLKEKEILAGEAEILANFVNEHTT